MSNNSDYMTELNEDIPYKIRKRYKIGYHSTLCDDLSNDKMDNIRSIKPISKLRVVKTALPNIVLDTNNREILDDAINRSHQITIHVYMFMRLYVLDKYHNGKDIPHINKNFISKAISCLINTKSCGPKVKGDNLKLLNEFDKFYTSTYKHLGYNNKINGSNLSHILGNLETDIITNIENNIKLNFFKYVNQFANVFWKPINKRLIEKANKKDKIELKKLLDKELKNIKEDLINNTLLCNSKYHKWITKHRSHIFPNNFVKSYEFDILHYPQNYLKNMIYMSIEIEKFGGKSFQFFPIRSDLSPKYIAIDTATIVELFMKKNKNHYNNNIRKYENELWEHLIPAINMDPVFKQSNYSFDHRILTDGVGVSIQLIENSMIEKSNLDKDKKKQSNKTARTIYKDMSQKQKDKIKREKEQSKIDNKMKKKLEKKLESEKKKLQFKNLTKEEKEKIKEKIIKEEELQKLTQYIEYPYLEELNDTEYKKLKIANNWVVCDPGKRFLLYMKSLDGIYFKYSNATHLKKTKRLKYRRIIQNYKDKNNISKIEKELTTYNSKSCIYETFKAYVKKKNIINKKLLPKYQEVIFRKYKWYGYINRRKAETDLVRSIKKTYGKDIQIIYGDWSIGHQMKNMISTPNISLKRKIGEYFKIYNIDEHRTSCISSKSTDENIIKTENLYLSDPKDKKTIRKMHSILTYKMGNKRTGCINRDKNAVENMIKITRQYLRDKTRPQRFTRGVKLEDQQTNKKGKNLEFMSKRTIRCFRYNSTSNLPSFKEIYLP